MDYGRCIVCGRRVKNKVIHRGYEFYICPRHVKGTSRKELSKYLDNLVKRDKSSKELYDEVLKYLSIIDGKITTLSDKLDGWMNVFSQRRLDEYKSYKDYQKIISIPQEISSKLDNLLNVDEDYDELRFLNKLRRKYEELHYEVKDRLITLYLERNIDRNRFRELNKKLLDRGYIYNKKVFKWIKTLK
ncbi:MAG TPA: hypothetical protein ENF47_04325 [Thermoprotei archaeon]|nr:hypothetical protein [Thermoprotei archaeon]